MKESITSILFSLTSRNGNYSGQECGFLPGRRMKSHIMLPASASGLFSLSTCMISFFFLAGFSNVLVAINHERLGHVAHHKAAVLLSCACINSIIVFFVLVFQVANKSLVLLSGAILIRVSEMQYYKFTNLGSEITLAGWSSMRVCYVAPTRI